MDASILLCDFAEQLNGKLYMMGAGWNKILARTAAPGALGILIEVPWDQANRTHPIKIEFLDEDGNAVMVEDRPVLLVDAQLEVGRPPGSRAGASLNAPMAVKFQLPPLDPGGYRFELSIDGEIACVASFYAGGPSPE